MIICHQIHSESFLFIKNREKRKNSAQENEKWIQAYFKIFVTRKVGHGQNLQKKVVQKKRFWMLYKTQQRPPSYCSHQKFQTDSLLEFIRVCWYMSGGGPKFNWMINWILSKWIQYTLWISHIFRFCLILSTCFD